MAERDDHPPDGSPAAYVRAVQTALAEANFDPRVRQPYKITDSVIDAAELPRLDPEQWPIDIESVESRRLIQKLDLDALEDVDMVDPYDDDVCKVPYVSRRTQWVYRDFIGDADDIDRFRRTSFSKRLRRRFAESETAIRTIAKHFDEVAQERGLRGAIDLIDATDPDSEAVPVLQAAADKSRYGSTPAEFWPTLHAFFAFAARSDAGGGYNPIPAIADELGVTYQTPFDPIGVISIRQATPSVTDAIGVLLTVVLGVPVVLYGFSQVTAWWPGVPADSWVTMAVYVGVLVFLTWYVFFKDEPDSTSSGE